MGRDEAARVEKHYEHLLCLAGMDPGLQGAWLAPWNPLFTLFLKAQILMQNAENELFFNTSWVAAIVSSRGEIFLGGSGDRGDQIWSTDGFFRIEVAHVGGGFPCLNLHNGIDCCFLQGLIAICSADGLFNFVMAFAGPGEIGNKILSARHAALSEG